MVLLLGGLVGVLGSTLQPSAAGGTCDWCHQSGRAAAGKRARCAPFPVCPLEEVASLMAGAAVGSRHCLAGSLPASERRGLIATSGWAMLGLFMPSCCAQTTHVWSLVLDMRLAWQFAGVP